MNAAWQAMAQARRPVWDSRLFWLTLTLAGIILLGALIILWIDRCRKRSHAKRFSVKDQLAQFLELYEQGQLSQEEFGRIRAALAPQLRQEREASAAASEPAAEQRPEAPKQEPDHPPA
jgi:hypothetical protein